MLCISPKNIENLGWCLNSGSLGSPCGRGFLGHGCAERSVRGVAVSRPFLMSLEEVRLPRSSLGTMELFWCSFKGGGCLFPGSQLHKNTIYDTLIYFCAGANCIVEGR